MEYISFEHNNIAAELVKQAYDTPPLAFVHSYGCQQNVNDGERIKGVKFEISKMNGEVVGTYTTDRNGVIYLPGISDAFMLEHISLPEYAVALLLAVSVIPIVELIKLIQRAVSRGRA